MEYNGIFFSNKKVELLIHTTWKNDKNVMLRETSRHKRGQTEWFNLYNACEQVKPLVVEEYIGCYCSKLGNLTRRGHEGNVQSAGNVLYLDWDVGSLGAYIC